MAAVEDFEDSLGVAKEPQGFDQWALVEVMGHKRFAGRVTEHVIAGQGFIRISVPAVEGQPKWTKFLGVGSIYAITPVEEQVARHLAANLREAPIEAWQLPERPRLAVRDADDAEDDPFDDDQSDWGA